MGWYSTVARSMVALIGAILIAGCGQNKSTTGTIDYNKMSPQEKATKVETTAEKSKEQMMKNMQSKYPTSNMPQFVPPGSAEAYSGNPGDSGDAPKKN